MEHYKRFLKYVEAYVLYSDIESGRDQDRKNATIMYIPSQGTVEGSFVVYWQTK